MSYPKDIYLAVGRDATRVEKGQLDRINIKHLWLAYTAKSEIEELAFKAGVRTAVGGSISHFAYLEPETVALMAIREAKG
jgi:hypothetical protein